MTIRLKLVMARRSACVLGCAASLLVADAALAAPRRRGDELARGRRAAIGEVLVRMRPERRGPAPSAAIATDPLADIEADEPIGGGGWRLIRSRSRSTEQLAAILAARQDVDLVEPNYAVRVAGTPDDLSAPLWALRNTGQRLENGDTAVPGVDLDATRAWDITRGSSRIVVGTLDTGVMITHDDLAANLWSAPHSFLLNIGDTTITCEAGTHGFNVVARTCDPADDHGHGTHVAGSLGAVGNNGSGVVGVNWTTSILALKFMDASGNGYISDAIVAIDVAVQVKRAFASTGDADIRVLNNSWSGGAYSQALEAAIARAADDGMLFVVAAGNVGADHEATPVYPADYSGANLVSVAALDYRDQLAVFSDSGATRVHVAAPGVLIYSTAISADPAGGYGTQSGTSMAAAYVSGVAALVLAHCDYSTGALRDALLRTAVPVPALAGRVQTGGRVNAFAALRTCDPAALSMGDVVVHARDIPADDLHGAWMLRADPTAADGLALATPDRGWSASDAALPHPADYVDVRAAATPGVPYRIWLRMRAEDDSKWNDSVWLQFSDAQVDGAPVFGINSTSGLLVNLEPCSGCGLGGWGWQGGAYWAAPASVVFGASGVQTLRIQTREDGVAIDQIVLSSATWRDVPPGEAMGDATVIGHTDAPVLESPPPSPLPPATPGALAFHGVPMPIPGVLEAEDFDTGGEGVSFHDGDPGNTGGAYRATGVDLEMAGGGGYNVGWVAPGEWLAYTVTVDAAGFYTAQFRVASAGPGGRFHMEIDGADVTGSLLVPDTGWWQAWQTVSATVSLTAGLHVARLVMDASDIGSDIVGNFDAVAFTAAAGAPLSGPIEAVGP